MVLGWAEAAVKEKESQIAMTSLAEAAYRVGDLKRSDQRFTYEFLRAPLWGANMPGWHVESMIQHRLGQPAEARRWFDKAEADLARRDGDIAKDPSLPFPRWIWDNLIAHVHRREAKRVLATPPGDAKPKTPTTPAK